MQKIKKAAPKVALGFECIVVKCKMTKNTAEKYVQALKRQ